MMPWDSRNDRLSVSHHSDHILIYVTYSMSEGSSAPTQIKDFSFSFSRNEKFSSVGCADR